MKQVLPAVMALCAGVVLLAAWLTWDVWASVRDGELALANARNAYQTMTAAVLVVSGIAAVQWHGAGPHPPGARRFAAWAAAALLACAAMPLAALLAIPA